METTWKTTAVVPQKNDGNLEKGSSNGSNEELPDSGFIL